jgi:energy-coupling factor transport system permease protein
MRTGHNHCFSAAVKIFVFLCATVGVFLAVDVRRTWVLTVLALAYLAFQREWRQALNWLVFYGLVSLLLFLNIRHNIRIKFISEFYVYTFWLLTPVFVTAWDIISEPPGNMSAFLSRLRAPSGFVLGMLVIFRFFPTMKAAFRSLRESMRNRGLFGAPHMLRHPLTTLEYILVPMLLGCLQTADHLAASAVSRGIEAPVKRESYYDQKMKPRDRVCMLCALTATLLFLLCRSIG